MRNTKLSVLPLAPACRLSRPGCSAASTQVSCQRGMHVYAQGISRLMYLQSVAVASAAAPAALSPCATSTRGGAHCWSAAQTDTGQPGHFKWEASPLLDAAAVERRGCRRFSRQQRRIPCCSDPKEANAALSPMLAPRAQTAGVSQLDRVSILAEALPYMQKYMGKTIVVKYGGAAMKDPTLKVRRRRARCRRRQRTRLWRVAPTGFAHGLG